MEKIKVRFAPSPTGNVHIGNIRVAIFNWLFAKHEGGEFLVRVEDTDRQRSTDAAVRTLFESMNWLGLNHDGDILFQSTRLDEHRKAAAILVKTGRAVQKMDSNSEKTPIIFTIPYHCEDLPFIRQKSTVELNLSVGSEISLCRTGVKFFYTENGKDMEKSASLAGFHGLRLFNAQNETIFDLDAENEKIESGNFEFKSSDATKIKYNSREIFFHDHVKGEISKPLDSIKDFVIVRSDGTPVFHLANVCDDIAQNVNFIIRGDDHVENTFRHVFLFNALGHTAPKYAHLPMIVNQNGKPYSKRDGDAYVGDFHKKGFLPEALFNYLTLLGWSPGDDREKMDKNEMSEAFSLERVKSSPAKFDIQKLMNMNSLYIAEIEPAIFARKAIKFTADWPEGQPNITEFTKVARIMQSRTKILTQVTEWKYFFYESYEINQKELDKAVSKPGVKEALIKFGDEIANLANFTKETIENKVRECEAKMGAQHGALNLALRLSLTGLKSGPSIEEIIETLGSEKSATRIVRIVNPRKSS